jgi:4-hydroxy-tetrahydrodipicolinate reductase
MRHPILLSGLPGAMIREVLSELTRGNTIRAFTPLPFALTAESLCGQRFSVEGQSFDLVGPKRRDSLMIPPQTLAVDFTTPDAALSNARWYAQHGIPFVMGTTGGDSAAIRESVEVSDICAVIAPNMAVPIVLLLAAFERLAHEFPKAMQGLEISITESHQSTKRDTSGTAKAMAHHLSALGLPASVDAIELVRDPTRQCEMGVPREHLAGHAYHTYQLRSDDDSLRVELSHFVHGRRIYAQGALVAIRHLSERVGAGERGRVFSMTDALRH